MSSNDSGKWKLFKLYIVKREGCGIIIKRQREAVFVAFSRPVALEAEGPWKS